MQIPLICTTTIEIPLILEIQRTRRVYLYEPREDADMEILYLPYFEKRDRKRKDSVGLPIWIPDKEKSDWRYFLLTIPVLIPDKSI